MRFCFGIIAWILIFALAAQFFQAAPWLLLVFIGLIVLGVYIARKRREALEQDTLKILGEEPLGNILDANRAMTAESARMLVGDSSFSFEVVGESFYSQNFLALQRNLNIEDGQDWDDQATLIADPGNKNSKNAVAVFVSGLKLGYIPDNLAPRVYQFLMQHGGYAKADAAIYFSSADSQNSIWLDLMLPPNFRME